MFIRKFYVFFFLFLLFLDSGFSKADPLLVDRTILTVKNKTYFASQAICLCAIWNRLMPNKLECSFDWLQHREFPDLNDDAQFKSSHRELKNFLYVALIYSEVTRLQLFRPTSEQLNVSLNTLAQMSDSYKRCGFLEKHQLGGLRQKIMSDNNAFTELVDMILRARTYLRVHGPFEKNKTLLEGHWYWHAGNE